MKRILPYSLILASAVVAFACTKSSSDKGSSGTDPAAEPGENPDPGTTPQAEGGAGEAGLEPGTPDPSGNPILLNKQKTVRTFTPPGGSPHFVDGLQWSAVREQLFVALPFASNVSGGKGILTTFKPDGTNYTELRAGDQLTTGTIGNSIDKDGNLISAELKSITRTTLSAAGVGAVSVIATGYTTGVGVPEVPFDGPNDLVSLNDGTIYVTDPGYNVTPRPDKGRLYAILPAAPSATLLQSYDYNPSPNGIVVSQDQTTLYVGFTAPPQGSLPFVRKYTINADRTLTDGGKFVELPADSSPDGLAIDDSNNLYVAVKGGIAVFKASGEPYGGTTAKLPQTAIDGDVTSLTFGGADRMSLFVTTSNGKVLELKTTVAGLAQ